MHFPQKIIIKYITYRDSISSSPKNYRILYDEQKDVLSKMDLKNIIQIESTASNLILQLDVEIFDLSIEIMILKILNYLFQKNSSINNENNINNNNNTIIDESYEIKELSLKDLIYSFYQFVRSKGHFARDMKKIAENLEIAINNKHYFAFSEENLQDNEIISLQENRITNSNDKLKTHFHFSIEQTIYNSLYSIETNGSDNYYFIYYRISNTNKFYKFVVKKGTDYKEFQGVVNKYNYIKINFEEAEDRCNLFYELEWDSLENITKEQLEAVISNFVLLNGGKKKLKQYIENSKLEIFKKYDWNLKVDIATLNANKFDSSYAIKCSEFCPYFENCNPIENSMIETMKNRKPIEAKECNIEYTDFYEARKELQKIIERIVI